MSRTVSVVSGKGGTGKTSVAAALASLSRGAVVADCDVDAANLHLVLQPELKQKEEFVGGEIARIDPLRCAYCGDCAKACAFGAISCDPRLMDSAARIDPVGCEGCATCTLVCRRGAISMAPRRSGEWYVSDTKNGPMVHARLDPGQENSGKLVAKVRRVAEELAAERDLDPILVDGPPGIGCSAIAAVTGSDLAVIVTEPTVSGRHDLARILDLAAHFRVPAAVVINKWDLGETASDELEYGCSERGVPVIGRLPYTKDFVLAQRAGRSVVEQGGPAGDALVKVWNNIQELLEEQKCGGTK